MYCFRIRFVLGPHTRLEIPEPKWGLTDAASEEEVYLRSKHSETPIVESRELVLLGSGYTSEQDSLAAATRWRSILQVAFARNSIGADFGERAAKGMFTEDGLRWLEQEHGQRVLNDVHGIMTFECDPPPRFAGQSVDFVVGKSQERLGAAIEFAVSAAVSLTDQERLAYDLFSGSFFQNSADARFVMLMMALETLLVLRPRSEQVQEHITRMISETRQSDLEPSEIESIVGALNWFFKESIGSAGRRLAESLGDQKYMDEGPVDFFTTCYELRSRLVHGYYPRPSREEVDVRAASLETFVGHLISGPLLEGVDA